MAMTIRHWGRCVCPIMGKKGILVSPGEVRSIWLRHDGTFQKRLKALSAKGGTRGHYPWWEPSGCIGESKGRETGSWRDRNLLSRFLVARILIMLDTSKVSDTFISRPSLTLSKIGFAKLYDQEERPCRCRYAQWQDSAFLRAAWPEADAYTQNRGTEYCGNRKTTNMNCIWLWRIWTTLKSKAKARRQTASAGDSTEPCRASSMQSHLERKSNLYWATANRPRCVDELLQHPKNPRESTVSEKHPYRLYRRDCRRKGNTSSKSETIKPNGVNITPSRLWESRKLRNFATNSWQFFVRY